VITAQALITDGLTIAGGVWALASAFANTLPKTWGFTRFCAIIAADLRGVLDAAPATVKKPDDGVTHITFTDDK
jgi:hypothetical protein